jgi:hypothetical protein
VVFLQLNCFQLPASDGRASNDFGIAASSARSCRRDVGSVEERSYHYEGRWGDVVGEVGSVVVCRDVLHHVGKKIKCVILKFEAVLHNQTGSSRSEGSRKALLHCWVFLTTTRFATAKDFHSSSVRPLAFSNHSSTVVITYSTFAQLPRVTSLSVPSASEKKCSS